MVSFGRLRVIDDLDVFARVAVVVDRDVRLTGLVDDLDVLGPVRQNRAGDLRRRIVLDAGDVREHVALAEHVDADAGGA